MINLFMYINNEGGNMKRIEKRKINQNQLLLIALLLVVLLIGMIILFKVKSNHPKDNFVYQEFDAIGGMIDNDKYYLFGAKRDISFKIQKADNFSFKLLDEDGKQINVKSTEEDNQITILAPEELYEEGKTYYLSIQNGIFLDDKYSAANEIIFSILRSTKQSSILKDDLLSVNIKDIKITDNKIKLDGSYKENDIILGYDKNNLSAVYKIVKKSDNDSYEYIIPEMSEIFKKIDYYGMEKIDLSDYANNNEFSLSLISTIKAAIINSLADTVYAKEDVTINKPVWNKKDNTLKVGITIDTANKEKFLTNHNAKIELIMTISADLYYDITSDNYDYILVLKYNTTMNHNLINTDNSFTNFYNDIKGKDTINDYDIKWVEENYSKINIDKVNLNQSIGNILVNTNVPGLNLLLDTNINFDINSKVFLDSSFTDDSKLIIGFNNKNEIYHSYQSTNTGNGNFVGDMNNKTGTLINTKLSFLNILNFNVEIDSGIYSEGKSTITVDTNDDISKDITFNIDGNYLKYQTCLVQFNNSEKKTIIDNKNSLNKYSKKIKLLGKKVQKEDEDNNEEIAEHKDNVNNNTVDYKYTADKVRELLQQAYDDIASQGEWQTMMGSLNVNINVNKTIDVNTNQITGIWNYNFGAASYTCSYNYLTEEMNCNNFENVQNYIKGICDNLYSEYLKYQETGETEMESAIEWEEMYGELDACYYDSISRTAPVDFKDDFQKILNKTDLTTEDLGVLKQ